MAFSTAAFAGESLETATKHFAVREYAAAFDLFEPLAERGDGDAQFYLGIMYFYGHGVEKNYWKAGSWYRRSAEQGNADAQNNLGAMYYHCPGVGACDSEAAARWYRMAADQGDAAG
jgi:TPR repeat protein